MTSVIYITDPMKETKIDLFYRGFSAQSSSIPSISCNSAAKPMASSKNSSNSSMGQAISSTSSSSPMISVIITYYIILVFQSTVFPQIVSAETILIWGRYFHTVSAITLFLCSKCFGNYLRVETIQRQKLFTEIDK